MHSLLTIAGSDPTGGAGLQADLQVCRAFGVHGMAVPSALTVQDGLHVRQVLPVFPSVILEQLRVLLGAITPSAIKIGMLASDDIVRNVSLGLAGVEGLPVVIDPVLAASDGTPLLERRAYAAFKQLATGRQLLTPNWPEMEILSERALPRRRDGEEAARELLDELKLEALLLKGGHLEGDASDLLVQRGTDGMRDEVSLEWLPGERLPGPPVHGTGCALSTAITAGLALGEPLREAVARARDFVRRAIANARPLDNGARILDWS
ncbi:MAG: hydroxymethylpyrimidine/phosphomethylpyrimidine kinase [Deltaproteobacteria bacterium]|jgi:hydroxymethylpyrimidine/phosphomethylpyrimidine kinase|nr:hydroxymethylpyrimidine/phosphomethylpyrimidine kinase [Deltaproteobacteria bacterium]